MRAAVGLYHRGLAGVVVLCGGVSPGAVTQRPEAEGMAALARELGVPEKDLLLETESRTTAENANFVYWLLAERNVRRVLVVTHGYHLRRATRLFARAGLDPIPVLMRESFIYEPGQGSRTGLRLLGREIGLELLGWAGFRG